MAAGYDSLINEEEGDGLSTITTDSGNRAHVMAMCDPDMSPVVFVAAPTYYEIARVCSVS